MYQLVSQLLEPYTFCMLLMLGAIIALWRSAAGRRVKWAVTLPYALLYLCSLHPLTYLLLGSLEWRYESPAALPQDTPMVVLSGGYILPNRTRPEALPSPATFVRMQHAADIYRAAGRRLVICSGGRFVEEFPEPDGRMMCRYLEHFDVLPEDLIPEEISRNTWQNATESARILREKGYDRAIVVTQGTHMYRSVLCFAKQGIAATPAPVYLRANEFKVGWPLWFLPHIEALFQAHETLHEYLGLVWYWVSGRI